jgi:hypothetical protein
MTTPPLCPGEARLPGDLCVAGIEGANKHRGLELVKSRRGDPRALDYGGHWLVDMRTGDHGDGGEFGVNLREVDLELLS